MIFSQSGRSSFALESLNLDDGGTAYFSATHEMAARAFQSWVEDRLADKGRRNDYLSVFADNRYHIDPITGAQWKPYPEGEERTRINAAFDLVIKALQKSNTLAKATAIIDGKGEKSLFGSPVIVFLKPHAVSSVDHKRVQIGYKK